jgi:hypothetical protein
VDRIDQPPPQPSPRAHRDDAPGVPPTPRPGVATANARTCDECGTTYSGESCPNCRTGRVAPRVIAVMSLADMAASYVPAGSAA